MPVLKGSKNFYDYSVTDSLAENLRSMIDYGFVEAGAYTRVTFDSTEASGHTRLYRTTDPRYGDDRVFEGLGPSWVWESGISPVAGGLAPFPVSGVYVNDIFYPVSTSGDYSHIVDYRHGRVIFDSDISTSDIITCEYTCREVGVYNADSREWKTIIDEYVPKLSELETLSPSGMAQHLKENRVWLPSIFIEVEDRDNSPLQLGGGEVNEFVVSYHVFSDRAFSARKIADILNDQYQTRIDLYDVNTAPKPYKYNGS